MKKNDNMAPWFYSIDKPGYNFRLSDINCALGLSQLSKLDFFIKKRRKIADIYNNYFLDSEFFVTPKIKKNIYHSFHLYPLLIDFKKLKIDKKNFFLKSKDHKIFYQVHYIPIYRQPYYKKKYKLNINDFPNSENFYKKEVSLPIHPSLSVETIKIIVKSIFKILK
jgi:UDP-4-amino-4,6-dideoxy-L-N-acetyl-beta-L-altrosamine transaminase